MIVILNSSTALVVNLSRVILNEVKNLILSMNQKMEILRLMPQNDIMKRSPGRGDYVVYVKP